MTEQYDYIFFDLGAGISKSSLAFILSSDECFLITTPEPTSIADAYSILKHIVTEKADLPISVCMNRSRTIREGNRMLEKFNEVTEGFLNKKVEKLGVLPNDPIVTEAVTRQKPYVLMKENAFVSRTMRSMVQQYVSKGEGEKMTASTSFVQRIKQFLLVR